MIFSFVKDEIECISSEWNRIQKQFFDSFHSLPFLIIKTKSLIAICFTWKWNRDTHTAALSPAKIVLLLGIEYKMNERVQLNRIVLFSHFNFNIDLSNLWIKRQFFFFIISQSSFLLCCIIHVYLQWHKHQNQNF